MWFKNLVSIPHMVCLLNEGWLKMQFIKNLRHGRTLDFILFRGIPETQPPTYGQKFLCIHESRERFSNGKICRPKAKKNGGSAPEAPKVLRKLVRDPKTKRLYIKSEKIQ
jgi:hypothetical protein